MNLGYQNNKKKKIALDSYCDWATVIFLGLIQELNVLEWTRLTYCSFSISSPLSNQMLSWRQFPFACYAGDSLRCSLPRSFMCGPITCGSILGMVWCIIYFYWGIIYLLVPQNSDEFNIQIQIRIFFFCRVWLLSCRMRFMSVSARLPLWFTAVTIVCWKHTPSVMYTGGFRQTLY